MLLTSLFEYPPYSFLLPVFFIPFAARVWININLPLDVDPPHYESFSAFLIDNYALSMRQCPEEIISPPLVFLS